MQAIILRSLEESVQVKNQFIHQYLMDIETAARQMSRTLSGGGKILLFGNGGSAADAQHIAAEFINRFQMERPPLAALALTTDTSVLTSIGNDYCFDDIFLKQVQALGRPRDMAMALSTSGNSPNVLKAAEAAKQMGLTVMGLSGPHGGLKHIADMAFCVPSTTTARVQEAHILLAHILCDLTERLLYPSGDGTV